MSQAFIGEIRCFGFQFAPIQWAFCNGQLMSIAQNNALFAILGTTYGGDGINTFALPNLQGNAPMHWGAGAGGFTTVIGQTMGTTTVTLQTAQIPQHNHTITVQEVQGSAGTERTAVASPTNWLSNSSPGHIWKGTPTLNAQFSPQILGTFGASFPHENMQPYLAVNFCICLFGVFPSRN